MLSEQEKKAKQEQIDNVRKLIPTEGSSNPSVLTKVQRGFASAKKVLNRPNIKDKAIEATGSKAQSLFSGLSRYDRQTVRELLTKMRVDDSVSTKVKKGDTKRAKSSSDKRTWRVVYDHQSDTLYLLKSDKISQKKGTYNKASTRDGYLFSKENPGGVQQRFRMRHNQSSGRAEFVAGAYLDLGNSRLIPDFGESCRDVKIEIGKQALKDLLPQFMALHENNCFMTDFKPANVCYDKTTKKFTLIDFQHQSEQNMLITRGNDLYYYSNGGQQKDYVGSLCDVPIGRQLLGIMALMLESKQKIGKESAEDLIQELAYPDTYQNEEKVQAIYTRIINAAKEQGLVTDDKVAEATTHLGLKRKCFQVYKRVSPLKALVAMKSIHEKGHVCLKFDHTGMPYDQEYKIEMDPTMHIAEKMREELNAYQLGIDVKTIHEEDLALFGNVFSIEVNRRGDKGNVNAYIKACLAQDTKQFTKLEVNDQTNCLKGTDDETLRRYFTMAQSDTQKHLIKQDPQTYVRHASSMVLFRMGLSGDKAKNEQRINSRCYQFGNAVKPLYEGIFGANTQDQTASSPVGQGINNTLPSANLKEGAQPPASSSTNSSTANANAANTDLKP